MDHQTVKTVAYTQWAPDFLNDVNENVRDADIMSYCARVSNPGNQENWQTAEKLLTSCLKKEHWSVFEMANVVLEIKTTRDIARQILRHRSFHFQEFSQRYAEPGKELGMTTREARFQHATNRQASIKMTFKDTDSTPDLWETLQTACQRSAQAAYDWAIRTGIAKEQARAVMPEGMTQSVMYMNGTVRDWFHFCRVRRGEGVQLECQDIAHKAWAELIKIYPFLDTVVEQPNTIEELQAEIKNLKAVIAEYQNVNNDSLVNARGKPYN